MRGKFLVGLAFLVFPAVAAHAEVRMSGTFVADSSCPATQTIKTAKNPGNVSVKPGQSYDLLAGNRTPPTHYWIRVPGARPDFRWVAVGCGHLAGASVTPKAAKGQGRKASGKPTYVFAVAWEPSFCATRPEKAECAAETAQSFQGSHLVLHGLWPQPYGNFYCRVSEADKRTDRAGHWQDLPEVKLDAPTRKALDRAMPGTQSDLDRHEWLKHGTCTGESPQAYFATEIALLGQVNASPVRALFADNAGKTLTSAEIRAGFDKAFGEGAGERVRVSCLTDRKSGRRLISEVTLGLAGPIGADSKLGDLMLAASPTRNAGCNKGLVDRPGAE
jgi:ribonuclease T2